MEKIFTATMSKDQCKDTGMAMVLILLGVTLYTGNLVYLKIAIIVLLVDMIVPRLFYPIAVIWFGLSNLMGAVMSRVLLSLVYFIIIFPIGMLRRAMKYDSLKLREWKKSTTSVMKSNVHVFKPADLENPY